jgi:DNA end-binding protein Ku
LQGSFTVEETLLTLEHKEKSHPLLQIAADKYFADLEAVKFDPELVNLASELIERNSGPFNPKRFKDTYAEELRKLVEKKAKGQKIEIPKTEKAAPSNVVNLMDALKKSLKGAEEKQAKPARKRKTARS